MEQDRTTYQNIQTLIEAGKCTEAIESLEELLKSSPEHAASHNDLGVLYFKQGNTEKALLHYQLAARFSPDNIVFQKNLADYYYFELGDVDEAIGLYISALDKEPDNIDTLMNLGYICIAVNRSAEAKLFYNRILELDPLNEKARQVLDEIQGMQNAVIDPAVTMQADSATQECTNTCSPVQKETSLPTEKCLDEAIDTLEKNLCDEPNSALTHNDLGSLYYNKGDKLRTLFHFERAARLAPNNIIFQKNLADFYFVELGKTDDAIALYLEALNQDGNNIETLMNLGHISTVIKRPEEAKLFFGRILELEPWNSNARENLEALKCS